VTGTNISCTPLTLDELSGQALGLHSSGMLTMQGVGAAVAGSVAKLTSPATGIVVTAAASLAATLLLAPGLRGGTAAEPEQEAATARQWRCRATHVLDTAHPRFALLTGSHATGRPAAD
jgi:membrane protein implicated in regulation of membrane protease activity